VKPRLGVIIASTRENRAGGAVADWIVEKARVHGGFDVEVLDLKEIGLPMLSEPNHPRFKQYTLDSTKRWSATVAALDAFVLVTPEYNHGTPPALANALDHLFFEWHYKPVGLVSYGGVSAGLRGIQSTKLILVAMKMVPLMESVPLPLFSQMIDKTTGRFVPGEARDKAAETMLDELVRWESALKVLRPPQS
jgi:NAD(P)H-dependent FMN reductase